MFDFNLYLKTWAILHNLCFTNSSQSPLVQKIPLILPPLLPINLQHAPGHWYPKVSLMCPTQILWNSEVWDLQSVLMERWASWGFNWFWVYPWSIIFWSIIGNCESKPKVVIQWKYIKSYCCCLNREKKCYKNSLRYHIIKEGSMDTCMSLAVSLSMDI